MDVGSLFVKLGLDTKEFASQLKTTEANLQAFSKKMTDTGKKLSVAVTAPLTLMAGLSVKAFTVQEDAELKLRAALQANGRAVDSLFQEYKAFASEMQRVTIVGDEVSLQMLQAAESFGITGDAAMRAVKNAIAMEAAFGVNAQAAIKMTAALEQGDTALLTRYIPSLRSAGSDTEKLAMAHDVLGRAFSVAEEQAKTSSGQMQQMTNAIGDLQEQFGAIIAGAITPFIVKIREVAERLQKMSDQNKRIILVIASLAAAIGPALLALGGFVAMASKAVMALRLITAAASANPFGLMAAGIGILATVLLPAIIRNFDGVKAAITPLITVVGDLFKEFQPVVKDLFAALLPILRDVADIIVRSVIVALQGLTTVFTAVAGVLLKIVRGIKSLIGYNEEATESTNEYANMTREEALVAVKEHIAALEKQGGVIAQIGLPRLYALKKQLEEASQSQETVVASTDAATRSIERLLNTFQKYNQQQQYAKVAQDGLNEAIDAGLLGQNEQVKVTDSLIQRNQQNAASLTAYRQGALQATDANAQMLMKLSELGEMAESAIQGTMLQGMYAVTDAFNVFFTTALNNGADAFGNFTKALLQSLKQILAQLLAAAAAAAALAAVITIATGGTGKVFDFFKGGSSSLLGGLFGGITGFGSFAEGGIVSGPTLGLVGEYAGARSNPEVIAPLNKLQSMIGGMGGEVKFRIEGRELVGVLSREGQISRRV